MERGGKGREKERYDSSRPEYKYFYMIYCSLSYDQFINTHTLNVLHSKYSSSFFTLTVPAINSLNSQGSESGGFAYIIRRTMRIKSVLIYA